MATGDWGRLVAVLSLHESIWKWARLQKNGDSGDAHEAEEAGDSGDKEEDRGDTKIMVDASKRATSEEPEASDAKRQRITDES